jgi:4-hydroxysphinganine ceramide fatty acyl 2-hydroxylase
MKDIKISNKGTARLFSNNFLEKLTRTHFLVPVLLYFLISAVCIAYAIYFTDVQMWKLIYLFPFGMVTFSLVEYLIHRFVFHFKPTNDNQVSIQYHIHGVHHEYPRDKDRLVMPPVMSVAIALLFFGLFRLIIKENVWLFFPGFTAGYSTYLLIHYAVHRYKPPANFLKYLWRHHSLHHYHSTETAFSVSFPLWDYLFGTMPVRRKTSVLPEIANRLPDTFDSSGTSQPSE